MRRNRFLQVGVVFLILSILLTWLYMRGLTSGGIQGSSHDGVIREVVMARQTIPERTIITPYMVHLQSVDTRKESVPADVLTTVESAIGKITAAEIQPGRPIAASAVLTKAQMGLAGQVATGRRAITIQVGDTTSVAGLIRPGDRVDVLATLTGSQGGTPMTDTVLQDIEVLAVGKSLDQQPLNASKFPTLVTLAVTPREAEALTFTATRATLNLVLRPVVEDPVAMEMPSVPVVIERQPVRATPVRKAKKKRTQPRRQWTPVTAGLAPAPAPARPELLYPIVPVPSPPVAERPAPRTAPAAPAPVTVEVIRGTQRQVVPVQGPESARPAPAEPAPSP